MYYQPTPITPSLTTSNQVQPNIKPPQSGISPSVAALMDRMQSNGKQAPPQLTVPGAHPVQPGQYMPPKPAPYNDHTQGPGSYDNLPIQFGQQPPSQLQQAADMAGSPQAQQVPAGFAPQPVVRPSISASAQPSYDPRIPPAMIQRMQAFRSR